MIGPTSRQLHDLYIRAKNYSDYYFKNIYHAKKKRIQNQKQELQKALKSTET